MQPLHTLNRDQLIALVESLELRLAQPSAAAPAPGELAAQRRDQLIQQRVAAVIEMAEDAVFSRTLDGTILSWNRSAERLLGYRAADIIGHSVELLMPPAARVRDVELIRSRLVRGETVERMATVVVARSGEQIDVSMSVAPLVDPDGDIVGASTMLRDVRASKRSQRELDLAHARLAHLAAHARDWCWEQDENLRFIYHSAEAAATSRRRFVGSSLSELPIVWPSEQHQADHARTLQRHAPFRDVEFQLLDADGRHRTLSLSGEPVVDAQGRFRGYRGTGRDIGHERQAVMATELLAAITDLTDDAVIAWSAQAEIRSWNPAAQALLGYEPEEIIGRPVSSIVPAHAASDPAEPWRSLLAGGSCVRQDTALRHRNGTVIPVALTGSTLRDGRGELTLVVCLARDVRRQRLQERLVNESHQRLRLALESAQLGLWDWDVAGERVTYSDEAARLLGYAPGEPTPERWLGEHLAPPEDVGGLERALRAHLPETDGWFEHEFRMRAREGAYRWVKARGRVVSRDREGNALRMLGTLQDVTVQRRAGQLERMLSAFLDTADNLIVARALDGEMLYWNRGAERTLGWASAEILGRSCLTIVPDDRRMEAARLTRIVRAGHRVPQIEAVRRHKDGRELHLSLSISPLRDAGGTVIGLAAIGRDVTDYVHAQRRLRASEERLRALVENTTEAVWTADAAGEVIEPAASWQRYTGQSPDQALALGWLEAVHPDDRADVAARWLACVRSGEVFESEQRVRRADGEWRHMAARGTPVRNADGGIREWFGVLTDITERRQAEAARSLLAAVVESSQDAIISHDFEGRILSWNRGAHEIFGYTQEEIIGCDYRVLLADADSAQLEGVRERILRGERVAPFELAARHRDGHDLPLSVSLAGLRTQHGETVGVTAVARDISEQRLAQRALRESERQLESILNNAAEGMIVLSSRGGVERMNLVAQRMFGCDAEDARHMHLRHLVLELRQEDPASGEESAAAWVRRFLGGRRELTGRRLDGSLFPLELALSEIALSPGPPKFTAVVRDITERKNWESRIYSLAYSDPLTGLPNRLLLRDRLEHAIAAAQRNRTLVGVLFLDLDYFKAVNDAYGHHIGDHLLREIAERAKACVREIDTVSRLGGDEFVLVLPELREAGDAGAVARKILSALAQPYAIDGRDLRITPTVGISIYPHHGADADALLRNADTAMYHAKESGKNSFRFYSSEPAVR